MTLDPGYLDYPHRRHGMDHDAYAWRNLFAAAPVTWPGGQRVAVTLFVSLEWFPIIPNDTPFRAPGHMQTTYPDYRNYTAREYGTRVGFYRLLDAFARAGVRATIATNGAIAERYPSVIRDIISAGHEIVAHATDMNAVIAGDIPEAEERAIIAASLAALTEVSGRRPRGWHSVARSQSWNTPKLLRAAGLEYMTDWVNDELPYTFHTEAGPIVSLPINHELSDRQILVTQHHTIDSYVQQIEDAHAWLDAEAERFGGRMLPLHLTPYIMGLPYRMAAFERLLARLVATPGTWFATTAEVVDAASI